ncbi:MAG: hypothetical protein SNJ69_05625 [Chloroflexaceae bacterium]
MLPTTVRPATLDETSLARIRSLEQEFGSVIVAYRSESPFAPLTEEQLQKLKALEDELGVVLLAFAPRAAATHSQ